LEKEKPGSKGRASVCMENEVEALQADIFDYGNVGIPKVFGFRFNQRLCFPGNDFA